MQGLKPRRTLRGIAWMNEENGGSGNRKFVEEYASAPPQHVGAIESDLGAGHPLGINGIFSPSAKASLQQITSVLAPIGATLPKMRETGRSTSSRWLRMACRYSA